MIVNFLGVINIQEPIVLLSDFLLAAVCFYCYFDIKNKSRHISDYDVAKYWRRFFLFEGISFFVGGLAHGLYAYFGDLLHFLGWYTSVTGVFCFTWGMMHASFGETDKKLAYTLYLAIIISTVASTVFKAFWVIVVYCFLSMLVVVAINMRSKVISFKKSQSKGILVGTLLFMLAAALHIFRIELFGIASQITSHIVIAVGVILFGKSSLETMLKVYEPGDRATEEISG